MTHWRSREHRSIPEFDRGASLLFLFVILLPIAIVGGLCISYAVFAPELVQYEQRVEADASKGR